MTALAKYVHGNRGATSALARQVGVSQGQISRVASGRSKPSPDLARRIEQATDGAVRAGQLLGLEETGAIFDHAARPRHLNAGRWAATVSADGSLLLTSEAVDAMGFKPGERLVMHKTEDGFMQVHSSDAALKRLQDRLAITVPPRVSLIDELISERRAEAARE